MHPDRSYRHIAPLCFRHHRRPQPALSAPNVLIPRLWKMGFGVVAAGVTPMAGRTSRVRRPEDLILLQHVAKHGTRNWGSLQIGGLLPIRDQKACCNRFILLKKRCIKDKRSLSQLLQRAKDAVIHDAARNVNAAAAGAAGSSFVAGAAQASSFHHAASGSPHVAGGFAGSSSALHAAAAALNPLEVLPALTSPSIGINSQSRVSFKGGGVLADAQQQQQVQEFPQSLPLDGLQLDDAQLAWLKQAHIEAQRFTLSQVHANKVEGQGHGGGQQEGQQGGQQGQQGGGNSGEEVGRREHGAGQQRSNCANDGRGGVAQQEVSGLPSVDAHKQQQQQQQSASMSTQLANLRSQVVFQPGSLLAQALKLSHQPSFAAVSNLPLFSNFRSVTAPHSSARATEPHASSPHAATLSSTSTVAAAAAAAPAGATVSAPNSSSPAWSEPAFPTVQSGEVTDRFSSFSDTQFASAAEIGATSSTAAAGMMAAAASVGLDAGRSSAVVAGGSAFGGSSVGGGLNSTLPGGNDSGREGGSFTNVLRMSSAAFQHQQQQQMLLRQQWSGQAGGGQENTAVNAEASVHMWRPREDTSWFQQLGQSGALEKLAGGIGGEGGEAEKSAAAPAAGGGAGAAVAENQGFERGGGMLLLAEPATGNARRHDVQREHQQEKLQSDGIRHDHPVDASNPPPLQEQQQEQNDGCGGTQQMGQRVSMLGLQQSRRSDAVLEALTSGSQSWVGQAGRWVDEHQMQWRMQKAGENAAMGVGMGQAEQEATHADNLAEAEILRALHAEMESEEVLREYKQELQEFGEGAQEGDGGAGGNHRHHRQRPAFLTRSLSPSAACLAPPPCRSITPTPLSLIVRSSTTEILASVKEAVAMVEEEVAANAAGARPRAPSAAAGLASAIPRGSSSCLVSAMQRDSSTYCDEPEDTDDFAKWVESFDLKNREADVEAVLKDNAFMQELQSRIVPLIVERETFWTRYFYRLYRLQQAEDARADLVKRATTSEEEDLSWDVDDDADDAQSSPAAAHHGAAGMEKRAQRIGEAKDAGAGEGEKERDASSPAATSPQPEPSNRSNSSDSSAGSEWQVVSKDDASKEDGLKASQPSAAALTTAAEAAATPASDVSEPAALVSQPAAEPTVASGSNTTSADGEGAKEEGNEKKNEAEARGGKGKKEGGVEEEDEDWGEWE
ncbi:unnamed protein product [Closterium sp. NIES-64]|nr:unnamed protein product [Closterium sp. NIES-64]